MKDEYRPAAHWVLLSLLLGAAAVAVRVGVYLFASEFPRDLRYVLGCVEGVSIDVALGLFATAPLLVSARKGRLVAFVSSVALLFVNAAGAHYHALFQHLPTRGTLAYLDDLHALGSSIRAHAPLGLVTLEAVVPAIVCFVLARRFTPRFDAFFRERRRVVLGTAVLGTATLVTLARASGAEGQEYFGAIGPALHVALPESGDGPLTSNGAGTDGRNLELVLGVQRGLGTAGQKSPADPEYPFCRRTLAVTAPSTRSSAILLILESVDARAAALELNGVPVMPNLRRIVADGVSFPHFYATGNMSVHALPALFGGVPAVPGHALLLHWPLASVLGLPRTLRTAGYETAYFHGADLSFSHQREFLEKIGFDRIEPCPPDAPRYGWGAPDGVLFDTLRAYVEQKRASNAGAYFATAFTVSTHDPYELPPSHRVRFPGNTPFDHFAESLAYLDDELGRFYDWFRKDEATRGTILVVTGDHAPRVPFPGDPTDTTTGEFEYRFEVPLVLVGLDAEAAARATANAGRTVGGHEDVPATLSAALGVAEPACEQGVNLLGADVPSHRFVPSVAGEALEFVYAHEPHRRWMLALRTGRFKGYDPETDPTFQHDLAPTDPRAPEAKLFLQSYLRLMNALVASDRLAPPEHVAEHVPALPRVTTPLVVFDGASTRPDAGSGENVVASLERAVSAGAKWIALDVDATRDHVPVVVGANGGTDGGATRTTLDDVVARFGGRVGLFLELEHQVTAPALLGLVRGTLHALERLPEESHVVIGSTDEVLLTTLQPLSKWPLAYRLEEKPVPTTTLDFAHERGFDWVSLRCDLATEEVIRAAHERNVRVLVYSPASPSDLRVRSAELPDGLMTAAPGAFSSWPASK